MNQEQVMGVVRHTLTFLGGLMVMYGQGDPESWMQIIGSATTLVGLLWSVWAKKQVTPAE